MRKVLVALTAAYIALLPSFYLVFNEANRFNLFWDRAYHLAIVTAIACLGLAYLLAYALLQLACALVPALRRFVPVLVAWVLVVIFIRSCMSLLDRSGHLAGPALVLLKSDAAKILYYVVVPGACFLLRPAQSRRAVAATYQILSPLLPILLLLPLTWPVYSKERQPLPLELPAASPGAVTPAEPNVYLFLLDEWSFERTFPDGHLRDDLPGFRALLATSTFYTNAWSPGSTTLTSVPRLLFPTDPRMQGRNYDDLKKLVMSTTPVREPSIFANAPTSWFTVAVGFWHDYPRLVGHDTDYAVRFHNEAARRTYGSAVHYLLATQFAWLRFFGVRIELDVEPPSVVWIYSQQQIYRTTLDIIRNAGVPTFGFFHFCLPHFPYVYNRDGMKDPFPTDYNVPTATNYLDNLRYTDRVVGELLDAMKSAGKFDASLVIFTSDHDWRFDPDRPGYDERREDFNPDSPWKHVPLIVKHPDQRHAEVSGDRVRTADLYRQIDAVWSGR